jgi:hypothetical protein
LLLNIEFEDCDDPTQQIEDTTDRAFIINASESGGVLFSVTDEDQIVPAMHVVRQAYQNVSE